MAKRDGAHRRRDRAARWGGALGLAVALMAGAGGRVQAETWAERLGYPAGKKVLLLHADDVGMCFEANQAAERYLEDGDIRSASAMVPCPWFHDFWAWYKENPELDCGLHLTLTSEWRTYRWGPVAPKASVPGLVSPQGYFFRTVVAVASRASPEEIERELRAQIDRAIALGPRPGHLDAHMGTLYARLDYARVFLRLAVEYKIPAMVVEPTPPVIAHFRKQGYPMTEDAVRALRAYPLPKLDLFLALPVGRTYAEVQRRFAGQLAALPAGLTEIVFHPATPSPALKQITRSWRQRGFEARLFRDPQTKALLRTEGVILTDWKEIMRRFEARGLPARATAPANSR